MYISFLSGRDSKATPLLCVLALTLPAAVANAQSGTLTVQATAVLEGAGRTGSAALSTDGSGTAAPTITLAAGTNRVLTFSSITGSITYNSGGNYNDPDGVGNPNTENVTSYQGISGFSFSGRAGFLLGVFINGAPTGYGVGSSGSNTSSFSYTSASDAAFTSLPPALNQAFFIGDGLTGDGSGAVQNFFVPNGATALVLGYEDANGYQGAPASYADNSGFVSASYNISGAASAPEPSSLVLLGLLMPLAAGFAARRRRRE